MTFLVGTTKERPISTVCCSSSPAQDKSMLSPQKIDQHQCVVGSYSIASTMKALVPLLTPQGRLTLDWAEDAAPFAEDVAGRIEAAFARGHGHGLLQLGAGEIRTTLPPAFSYWREFAGRFVTAVCGQPDAEERKHLHIPSPDPLELEVLASAVPPMTGAEYLSG